MTPIHNNKQNKVPLREEGVDPAKVKAEDKVLWIDQSGKGHSKYSSSQTFLPSLANRDFTPNSGHFESTYCLL
jgi:hypothetical protein